MFEEKKRTIVIGGVKVPIDPDFRLMCRLYSEGASHQLLNEFYFAGLPDGVTPDGAVKAMLDFYLDGIAPGRSEESEGAGEHEPVFDFAEDEALFYAAFLAVYGIDLNTVKLHWVDFCALFKGLPDECRLKQVLSVRATKMQDVPKYDRGRIAKLKRIYALRAQREPKYASAEERDNAMKIRLKKRFDKARKQAGEVT
jgi:hypothetical protein